MTKPTKWLCAQRRQISLGIRPVWSESSLCAQWVAKDTSCLHADSEDYDQTGRMPRLIWVFAGRTVTLLVLSCRGSFYNEESQGLPFTLCSCSLQSYLALWSPRRGKRELVYMLLVHFILYALLSVSFFSSSLCRGLAVACDCSTPWTVHLTYLPRLLVSSVFVFLFPCFILYWNETCVDEE